MPGATWPKFEMVADHALLVILGDAISDSTSASVLALDRALAADPPPGMVECIPALVNLLVDFDPLVADHGQIQEHVQSLTRRSRFAERVGTVREVEICYGDDLAPDIGAVARQAGISVDDVVNMHLRATYAVRMYGFAPGYAYMSGVPLAIQVPRKPAAVRDIPAGSVLIAGPQCLVTTLTMPTGWSIIGRSPTRILTLDDSAPFLFDVGDTVRFKRIDRAQYDARRSRGDYA